MYRKPTRAQHRKPSREQMIYAVVGIAIAALFGGLLVSPAALASSGSISGFVWDDADRDGVHDDSEQALGSMTLYLFDVSGVYVKNANVDASGFYTFADLPDGSYTVKIAGSSWTPIRSDWTPTTGSLQPARQVQVAGTTTFDWGWRRIVRSTDPAAPVSAYTGPNGLEVRSYDDVVAARSLYDALLQGGLVGEEAADVTVRFDLTSTATTTASVAGDGGFYTAFHATSNLDYLTWLDSGPTTLFHEYGHAWSLYFAYLKQQDPGMSGYLRARGLTGDPRVNSTYSWNVKEMIAEDYRELFGSTAAQSGSQMNGEIPKAADVPGLADYLSTAFRSAPPPTSPEPAPSPSPEVTSLSVSSNGKSSYLVAFTLTTDSSVSVEIRDSKGQLVKALLSNKPENAGTVAQGWNRTDSQGRTVKRGTYTASVLATSSGQSAQKSVAFKVS